MRQSTWIIRLLLALGILIALIAGAHARGAPQIAAPSNCIFLPFFGRSGTPTAAQPSVNIPANCPTPPGQAPEPSATAIATTVPAEVSGAVRLLPESATTPGALRVPRYLVVLDTSGSMSSNFNGQCNNTGQTLQCANGPVGFPPVVVTGTGPTYHWNPASERRIYVAKKAVERLIGLANMPGNAGYDPSRPDDQMAVVWFIDSQLASNTQAFTNTPAQLISFVTNANRTNNDPYLTSGGTNGASGLYRAALMLAAAPPSVSVGGQTYTYENHVIFITDGVSNTFLDPSAANLSGGSSSYTTFPVGSACYNLGIIVSENAQCQTTDIGGMYNGKDRPITQMVKVSEASFKSGLYGPTDVYVIALSAIPSTGLKDGVASSASGFFSAQALVQNANGTTNVDQIVDAINSRIEQSTCRPSTAAGWADAIDAAHLPDGAPFLGQVILTSSSTGASYTAPIVRDPATGALSYRRAALPAGTYQLEASVFYKGDDGATRSYGRLIYAEAATDSLVVSLSGQAQALDQLSLRLGGDVCAAP